MEVVEMTLLVRRMGDLSCLNLMTTKLVPSLGTIWIFPRPRTLYVAGKMAMDRATAEDYIANIRTEEFWVRASGRLRVKSNFVNPQPSLTAEERRMADEIMWEIVPNTIVFLPL